MAVKRTIHEFCPTCGERNARLEKGYIHWPLCRCAKQWPVPSPPRRLRECEVIFVPLQPPDLGEHKQPATQHGPLSTVAVQSQDAPAAVSSQGEQTLTDLASTVYDLSFNAPASHLFGFQISLLRMAAETIEERMAADGRITLASPPAAPSEGKELPDAQPALPGEREVELKAEAERHSQRWVQAVGLAASEIAELKGKLEAAESRIAALEEELEDVRDFESQLHVSLDLSPDSKPNRTEMLGTVNQWRKRIATLKQACSKQQEDIQQTLGKALGYPWFKDDQQHFPSATEANGVFVGEHVAESLADEAAARIATLEKSLAEAEASCEKMRRMWDEQRDKVTHFQLKTETLTAELAEVKGQVDVARQKLETIVCTVPPDDGVVLLSNDGPTHMEPGIDCPVYDHVHFSPLGDALIELHELLSQPPALLDVVSENEKLREALRTIEQMTWGGKGESAVHIIADAALQESE